MQQIALSALTGFVAQLILCPFLIPVLKKLKFGQYIREEGPKAHQKKAGTPTMGGISILASFILGLIPSLAFFSRYWIVPAVTLMFGLIGFLDDYIKVVMKHNEGLKPYQKFSLQILFAALFALYLYLTGHETTITIHLLDLKLDRGIGY